MQKIILKFTQSEKIKNMLKNNNITHTAATKRCGMSYPYFERILNGKCAASRQFALFIKELSNSLYDEIFPKNYNIYPRKAASDLSVFLKPSKLKWYWMGFLLADGHFADKGISLTVAIKDKEHLEKFRQFVGHYGKIRNISKKSPSSDNISNCVTLWAGGAAVVSKLKEEFDIRTNKTYNPPTSIPTKSTEKIISLFIGLVDGDGSIPKRAKGSVTIDICMHKSWEKYVEEIVNTIFKVCGEVYNHHPYYDRSTFCIQISNPIVTKFLRKKADEFELPFLERKWNNIDISKRGRYEIRRRREKLLPSLINQGHSLQNIADMLEMHKSNLCRMIKRLGLESPAKRKRII